MTMFVALNKFLKRFTGSSANTNSQLNQQVQNLLAEANLPEAMQVLLDNGYPQVVPLKAQWKTANMQFDKKIIDAPTFNRTINRITYAVLEMVTAPDSEVAKVPEKTSDEVSPNLPSEFTEEQRQQIQGLLAEKRWEEALVLAKDWSLNGLLLYQRYERAMTDKNLGFSSQIDYDRTINQITAALFFFVCPEEEVLPPKFKHEQIQELHLLLAEDQLQKALELASSWNGNFFLLSTRHHQLQRDLHLGLITEEYYVRSRDEIKQEVGKLIGE